MAGTKAGTRTLRAKPLMPKERSRARVATPPNIRPRLSDSSSIAGINVWARVQGPDRSFLAATSDSNPLLQGLGCCGCPTICKSFFPCIRSSHRSADLPWPTVS